jgi:glycine/D-amino acid oxidase-like deaminating enzyme
MSPTIPSSVISQLVKSAHQDPSLPRPHPSLAFWQLPESELAHHRSSELSSQTTYAIIGSGVTGCSVAKNLLESLPADSGASVTVFEARALTSGATGRNGGHLISPLPHVFSYIEKVLGKDEATKIGRFANRTLDAMYALSDESSELSEAGETRRVTSVGAFYDQKVFDETRQSWIRYEQCLPECRGEHQVFGPEEALRVSQLFSYHWLC